ncbi:MAG: AAA family ATPase, partial [Candidatus Thorarchaeota archaeon]
LIPSPIDPFIRGMEIEERPKEQYKDIGGLEKQINEVRESIELSLKSPELFDKVGIESPKGVLLYGPPGSGKTLIAKAVAHETNATFISINGSEFVQKYIGEGARLVRELFQFAQKNAPAIIFIDEIDAIGSHRLDIATGGDREVARTFMQLLAEMDGFKSRGNVKIIGATNRIDILDEALLRPGRFDRHIFVDLPNKIGRLEIFKIHTQKMSLEENTDFIKLADLTESFNGAEIRNLCQEAGMKAIRDDCEKVISEHFYYALNKIKEKKKQNIPSNAFEYYS